MSRVVLIPDSTNIRKQDLSLAGKRMDRAARTAQLQDSRSLIDPAQRELQRYLTSVPAAHALSLAPIPSVTGVQVLEMSAGDADAMPAEQLGYKKFADVPLSLIRPTRAAGFAPSDVGHLDAWHLDAIGLFGARQRGFTPTGRGVTVAVLDTGVEAGHPEIADRVIASYELDTPSWDVRTCPHYDTDGHGTHVAGLIAGRNVGVAPDAQLLNVIMLPGGRGMLSDFVLALEWCATNPEVQVINLSAGISGLVPGFDDVLQQVQAQGLLLVGAVGNEGRDHSRSPGNYRDVLSVGATDRARGVAGFSGGGRVTAPDGHTYTVPDVVAPGAGVFSCVRAGGYEAWDGTSMATPIVSGIAALIIESQPLISVVDLIDKVLNAAQDLGLRVERQGVGLAQVTA